jgi:hypothetical protein
MALIADAVASPDKRPFLSWMRPKREKLHSNSQKQIKTEEAPRNSDPVIGGGFSPIDVDDPEVKEIAIFASSTIASKKINKGPTKLIKIIKAESQNVAGTNYKLTLELNQPLNIDPSIVCDVIVFDQSWTSTRILSESHCFPNKNPSVSTNELGLGVSSPINNSATVSKRQIPIVSRPIGGGFYPIDVENSEVKEMAVFASYALESKRNSGPAKVTKIVTAETQNVAGTNYKMTLEITQPSAVVDTDKFLLCKVVVFNQPWTRTRILGEWNCTQNKNPNTDKAIRSPTTSIFANGFFSFNDSFHVKSIPVAVKPIDGRLPLANEKDISPPNKRHIASGGFPNENPDEVSLRKIPERLIGAGFTRVKADDSPLNKTQIHSGLNPFEEEFSLIDVSETSPNKSEILLVPRPVEDGYSLVDVDDNLYVKEIAAYATTAISSSRNSISLTLKKILSAETKNIGGTNYKLTLELDHFISGAKAENLLCKVIIFDLPKEEYRKMTDSICLPIKNATVRTIDEVILESSLPLLSGFTPVDVQADDVREMAYFATHVISNTRNPVALAEIVKADSQVHAAGRNYKLTLKLDSMVKEPSDSITTFQSGDLLCEIIVFFQTWSNTRILSESNCLPIKTIRVAGPRYVPRYIDGGSQGKRSNISDANSTDGFVQLDVEDAKVREIATFATNTISANSGPVTLLRVLKAEAQSVAGKNYKMIIELLGTNSDTQICDVVVFDQERSKTRILIDSKCNPDKTTSIPEVVTQAPILSSPFLTGIDLNNPIDTALPNKRQIPGGSAGLNLSGFAPVDVNNPEVKEMANFATNSISASDNPFILKLIKVVDAEAKFLFGKNFKLILRVKNMVKGADGDREMLCEVII